MTIKPFQLAIPFTESEKEKLNTVQEDAEPNPPQVTEEEKTAGTELSIRSFGPKDIADMAEGGGGSSSKVVEESYLNNSGVMIVELSIVKSNSGGIDTVDVTQEEDVVAILGITRSDVEDTEIGVVVLSGLMEDIDTDIAVDSAVYLSKSGTLTSTPPDIGVIGFEEEDFVVYVGQVVENATDSNKKDLKLDIRIIGQL